METFTKQSLFLSLSLILALGAFATPAAAAVIYSSETQNSDPNDAEPGSGENAYFFDMGNNNGTIGGPRVGGTMRGLGGSGGTGGSGFGGSGGGFSSFSSLSDGGGGDGGTCTTNCSYAPPTGPDGGPNSGPTQRNVLQDSSVDPIPEPATLAILGAGLMGLGLMRRRRK